MIPENNIPVHQHQQEQQQQHHHQHQHQQLQHPHQQQQQVYQAPNSHSQLTGWPIYQPQMPQLTNGAAQSFQDMGTTIPLIPHQIRPTVDQAAWQASAYHQGMVNSPQSPYRHQYPTGMYHHQTPPVQQQFQQQSGYFQHQQLPQEQIQKVAEPLVPQKLSPNAASFKVGTSTNQTNNTLPPYAIGTVNTSSVKKSKSVNDENTNNVKKSFRNSRRRHRNSHLGCSTCKSRRIKCDEHLKSCRNCTRAGLACAYLALDDAAIEALKAAQKAQAARIEALNSQESAREAGKQMIYPYYSDGLPTKIFYHQNPNITYQPSNVHNLQLNLQRSSFQVYYPSQQQLPLHISQNFQPISPNLQAHLQQHLQQQQHVQHLQQQQSQPKYPIQEQIPLYTPNISSISSQTYSNSSKDSASDLQNGGNAVSSVSSDASDINYVTLHTFLSDNKYVSEMKVDRLSEVDGDNVEIVLDPECTKQLNKFWVNFDIEKSKQFDSGFESEQLYKEYDWYHQALVKEAQNNIVLFKSFMTHGAVLISQFSKNPEARKVATQSLNRDFEITLRFLNKFKVDFIKNANDISFFYSNVNLCFSKFQVYQTAVYSTVYGPHTFQDNVALSNRLFEFIINYLNNEFTVFLDEDLKHKYRDNVLYQRASLYNDYIHVFIKYFAQCVKAYHTRPYEPLFTEELLLKLKEIKSIVYQHLTKEHIEQYHNLEEFLAFLNEYWKSIRENDSATNRLQVIFYTMKKFLSILPSESHIPGCSKSFHTQLLYSFYHATTSALTAIFPETRFYFTFTFNGRDGTRTANSVLRLYDSGKLSQEQQELLSYPVKIVKFFKTRLFVIYQLLSDISNFPAKIILDDQNKSILRNIIQEEQVTSFIPEIPETAYPTIDKSSNFYNAETNSIVIPSVSKTKPFSNFETSQTKRLEKVTQSAIKDLTTIDQKLINGFYKRNQKNRLEVAETI